MVLRGERGNAVLFRQGREGNDESIRLPEMTSAPIDFLKPLIRPGCSRSLRLIRQADEIITRAVSGDPPKIVFAIFRMSGSSPEILKAVEVDWCLDLVWISGTGYPITVIPCAPGSRTRAAVEISEDRSTAVYFIS